MECVAEGGKEKLAVKRGVTSAASESQNPDMKGDCQKSDGHKRRRRRSGTDCNRKSEIRRSGF